MTTREAIKDTPANQEFELDGVQHISTEDAHSLLSAGKAILIDVREKEEYEVERIALPGVLLYPMQQIIDHIQDIPADRPIIVMDYRGERGTKVANLLNIQGFKQVTNLDGGLAQWKAEGFPVNDIFPDECGVCSGCS